MTLLENGARCWKRVHARDVLPPHRFYGYDQRVGARRIEATSQTSRTPRSYVTTQHVSSQDITSSSVQVQKVDEKNRKEAGTEKALQILEVYSGSGHTVIPATTIFEQGNLKTMGGKDNIHFNASEWSTCMTSKLIESVDHLCSSSLPACTWTTCPRRTLTLREKTAQRR